MQRKYGLSLDEYAELAAAQAGVCAICESPPARKYLHVDHDHLAPGDEIHVRGLLDFRCNAGISLFRDKPLHLLNAADYLLHALLRFAEKSEEPQSHPRMLSAKEHAVAREKLRAIGRTLRKLERASAGVCI